jgi:hypothetical protein
VVTTGAQKEFICTDFPEPHACQRVNLAPKGLHDFPVTLPASQREVMPP